MLSTTPHRSQDPSSSVGLVPLGSCGPIHKTPDSRSGLDTRAPLLRAGYLGTNDNFHDVFSLLGDLCPFGL